MDGISSEQVESALNSIKYHQEKMSDAEQLRSLFISLREKLEALKTTWNTIASENEIAKLEAIINDLEMVVVPYHRIKTLKEINVIATKKTITQKNTY